MILLRVAAAVGTVTSLCCMLAALEMREPGAEDEAEAMVRNGVRCLLPLGALGLANATRRLRRDPGNPQSSCLTIR